MTGVFIFAFIMAILINLIQYNLLHKALFYGFVIVVIVVAIYIINKILIWMN